MLPYGGPLTHAAVLVDRTDSFLVYACFHHAVADAWGINLALSQMFNEYASEWTPATTTSRCRATWTSSAQKANTRLAAWAADREYFVAKYREVEPALFSRSGSLLSRRRGHHALRVNPATSRRIRDTGRSVFAFTAVAIGEYLAGYITPGTSCSGFRSSTDHRKPNSAPSAA